MSTFPISFKPSWKVEFHLDQTNAFTITSGKGELYGHVSCYYTHGSDCIELFDHAAQRRIQEYGDDPIYSMEILEFLLSDPESLQKYLDKNIA